MVLRSRVSRDAGDFLMVGVGLAVIMCGVQGMAQGGSILLVTLAMTLGGIVGYVLDIDGWVRRLGDSIQDRMQASFKGNEAFSGISRGFVSSTLVICIGSMAIVGSLESGLTLDHTTLFTKSIMDFVINVLLATTLGAGVMLSAVPVFVYEALLSVGAAGLAPLLSDAMVAQMLATGSLLLFAAGTNLAGITDIKVANFLLACAIAPLLVPVLGAMGIL